MEVDEDVKERLVMKNYNIHQRNLREDGEVGEMEEREEREEHHHHQHHVGGCPAQ